MAKGKTRHGQEDQCTPDKDVPKPVLSPALGEPEDGDMATPKEEASTEDDKPLD